MARISHSVETITPQRARKYLERNTKNRRVRPKIVSRYALAMQQGQWSLTGEPILFDTEGNLLDGQHRLHACIESSCSFRTVVIRGIQQDTFADINTGSSRNPGDALYLAGYSKSKMCAAAIKVIHNMEIMEENPDVRSLRGRDITRQDLLAFMQEHEEEMIEATHVIEGEGRSILRPPSVFVALRFRFGQSNEMRAQ